MDRSLAKGHVLVLSVWDDHTANMLWLDSSYPADADPNKLVLLVVIFFNIKFGDIGSTYSGTPITLPQAPLPPGYNPPAGGTPAPAATQTKYGQCGGVGYNNFTQCAAGTTCIQINRFYSHYISDDFWSAFMFLAPRTYCNRCAKRMWGTFTEPQNQRSAA
ncbi:hypothetical protein EST38_g4127 [Candolleomyces aberdarensis]|uniref:CBM1 domain-containing protein n=1 Tax=Candolleomyces aberdarensis TaxID=2316362 RepID=A0A4Q2DNP4_9AGAR|nr:hypothetical protein EST38_g4127 [Candolleomyces aberdarensis]